MKIKNRSFIFMIVLAVCLTPKLVEATPMSHQKDITIVGGAGPQAGIMLADMIIRTCQTQFGCQKDEDFPYIQILSFPFADMLSIQYSNDVEIQLQDLAGKELTKDLTRAWVIACNTLHIYADQLKLEDNFVHIMQETKLALQDKEALILCTSASRNFGIHAKYLKATYPMDFEDQSLIDRIIQKILAGRLSFEDAAMLEKICLKYPTLIPVLGCTELSLLQSKYPLKIKVIDPCELLSQKLAKDWFYMKKIRVTH